MVAELKIGDTVDPRELPAGAMFTHSGAADYVVTKPGYCRLHRPACNDQEGKIFIHKARLVSLPC